MGDNDYATYHPCSDKQFEDLVAEFRSKTTAEVLCASLATPDFDIPGIKYGLNSAWIVICGAMVFIMVITSRGRKIGGECLLSKRRVAPESIAGDHSHGSRQGGAVRQLGDTRFFDIPGIKYGLNSAWIVICGAMVFIMHGGFAMLCAGAIRHKSHMNILMQTVLDACTSAISFYLVGFGFAYGIGQNPNKFIGDSLFALNNYSSSNTGTGEGVWTDFFFQWTFAATATTIPAGCVAERFNFIAYMGYSIFISSFVYPVVVHWAWSTEGWLGTFANDPLLDTGMVDFAGSGVVHMVGGLAGMMGAILVGPRLGRFDAQGKPRDMPGHSPLLVVLGTCLLWFGWYGFNPGSTLIIDNMNSGIIAGRSAVCTTLSGGAGGVMCMITSFIRTKTWDVVQLCNGVLVGFVSITAGAHVLEPWAAILAGCGGILIFDLVCWLFLKLKIDDPLSAAPMHGFGGAWGVIIVGLLAKEEYMLQNYPTTNYGLFYGGGGKLLACQIIGVIVIAAWVCGLMGIFFGILKYFGMLRISHDEELTGLDASKHGAANDDDMGGRQSYAKPVPVAESVLVTPCGFNETSNPSFV